ncbi:LPS assembly protein LptD [Ferrimonas balearica]|uniref:LPS assembly protein LptD n=1 Tax=Ferrimonas balearica TaxID=44012 RepID=UPI001C940B05|nr:LPS assembly protein LptD [Ferrimonas balearica]MBY5981630.1 LPS assembly protein LptD [Ferrimonas balearica]
MRFPLVIACCCLPLNAWAESLSVSRCVVHPPMELLPTEPEQAEAGIAPNQLPIKVNADRSEAVAGDSARFEGNVKLRQGMRQISAQSAEVSQLEGSFSAQGGLVYQDPAVAISADSLNADMDDYNAELNRAQYWLRGQQVHGKAEQLKIEGENNLLLSSATFTTCPQDDPDWLLEAKEINIDANEEWGEIWHAKVKLFDVPVFYVPYMTVPVSSKRKSGFLFPEFSTSTKNGVDVAVPYYWNIAPNLDATLTTQYMSSRGLFLRGEGRYLQPYGAGQVNLEYISGDRLLDDSPDRYLIHFEHAGKLENNWRLYGNFTTVSDDNYFNDFDSDVSASTDNQITREGEASYFTDKWDFAVRVQDIEVLGDSSKPFQVMPSLSFDYRNPNLWGPLDFTFGTELTHFAHKESDHLTATRWHMEPTLTLPYQTPAGSLTTEVKLMQTFYEQRDPSDQLEDFVSRTLPQFRLHGQVNFERNSRFGDGSYTQTLEPQFQYLYVPKVDQSDIGLYDTALLQEDYYGLFRDRRFSGLDRIADANQLTLGVSSRFFDGNHAERAQVSVGQILYFDDSEVGLGDDQSQIRSSNSALAAELELQASRRWFLSGSLQFDTQSGDTNKSEVLVDYRANADKLIQLSHRYVPNLGTDTEGNPIDINQAGIRTTWPLSDELYFVGNYYYDLNLSRSVESYAGLQYESCCWAIRLAYYRHLNTNYEDGDFSTISPRDDFDSGVTLKFVLKGLGSSGPLGVQDMLDEGVFNYRRPYYLRN